MGKVGHVTVPYDNVVSKESQGTSLGLYDERYVPNCSMVVFLSCSAQTIVRTLAFTNEYRTEYIYGSMHRVFIVQSCSCMCNPCYVV